MLKNSLFSSLCYYQKELLPFSTTPLTNSFSHAHIAKHLKYVFKQQHKYNTYIHVIYLEKINKQNKNTHKNPQVHPL